MSDWRDDWKEIWHGPESPQPTLWFLGVVGIFVVLLLVGCESKPHSVAEAPAQTAVTCFPEAQMLPILAQAGEVPRMIGRDEQGRAVLVWRGAKTFTVTLSVDDPDLGPGLCPVLIGQVAREGGA